MSDDVDGIPDQKHTRIVLLRDDGIVLPGPIDLQLAVELPVDLADEEDVGQVGGPGVKDV